VVTANNPHFESSFLKTKDKKTSLINRMATEELYVVFSGISGSYMNLHIYRDPEQTPRIYAKHALDDRLDQTLPICETFAAAIRRLGGSTYAVVLPLSEMIKIWGVREVNKWARAQRLVDPKEVKDYVANAA
jgi:hypothetical protein